MKGSPIYNQMDSTVQMVLLFVSRYCSSRGQTILMFTAWSNRIIAHRVVKLYYCSPCGQTVLLFITFSFNQFSTKATNWWKITKLASLKCEDNAYRWREHLNHEVVEEVDYETIKCTKIEARPPLLNAHTTPFLKGIWEENDGEKGKKKLI